MPGTEITVRTGNNRRLAMGWLEMDRAKVTARCGNRRLDGDYPESKTDQGE